ncbi:MAG: cell division protein FtsQ/DivIB [Syntrophomonadaceae bacterium]|jgi:cell division protein FtsQ
MKSSWSRRFIMIIVLLLVGLLSMFLFMHSSFFYIDKITVQGADKLGTEGVIRLSGLRPGLNIFSVDGHQISQALQVHPMVRTVKVNRHLPRHLEIVVTERQAWALMTYRGAFLCIDPEGIYIDKLSNFSADQYCIITMDREPEQVVLGQAVDPEATGAIRKIWEAIPAENRNYISDYHYEHGNKQVVLHTNRGTEILFGDLDRLEEKVQSLLQILNIEKDYAQTGQATLRYVDLRYKGQPVVKTN